MTINTTYTFEKAFRNSLKSLRDQYYNDEISREEYEDIIARLDYERGESVIEAMQEELAM